MADISAANASIALAVQGFPTTFLVGFDVDDAFLTEPVDVAETKVGVDGVLSYGLVFAPIIMEVMLQADSPSVSLFEAWYAIEQVNLVKYPAVAEIRLFSVRRSYSIEGMVLKDYTAFSPVRRVLGPRRFTMHGQPPIISSQF